LLEPPLLFLELVAVLFHLSLVIGALRQDFFLGFQQGFPLFVLGTFDGLVDDTPGFFLRADDLLFRNLLAVEDPHGDAYHKRDQESDHAN